jgi:hypothetical protein
VFTSVAVLELSATLPEAAAKEMAVEVKSGVGRGSGAGVPLLPLLLLACTRKYLFAPIVPVRVIFPDQLTVPVAELY